MTRKPPSEIAAFLVNRIVNNKPNPANKVVGYGQSIISCPFHQPDNTPSLSVNMEDGRFKCFSCNKTGNAWTYFREVEKLEDKEIKNLMGYISSIDNDILEEKDKWTDRKATYPQLPYFEARYDYQDENFGLYQTILRYPRWTQNEEPKRKYMQFYKTEDNKLWVAGRAPSRPQGYPLFNIGHILKDHESKVIVVEGEKCATFVQEKFCKRNQYATCWLGGASSPHLSDWSWVENRILFLIADADEPGHKCMDKLGRLLVKRKPKLVKIVFPPINSYTEKSDIFDWIKQLGAEKVRNLIRNHAVKYPLELNKEVIDNPLSVGTVEEIINLRIKEGLVDNGDFFMGKRKSKWIQAEKIKEEEEDKKDIEKAEPHIYFERAKKLIEDQNVFTIIGKADDETVLIRKNNNDELVKYSVNSTSPARLINLINDPDFWNLTGSKKKKIPGINGKHVQYIHGAIIEIADFLGRVRIDLLRGRGSEVDNGKVVFNTGKMLIIRGKSYPLDGGKIKEELKNTYVAGTPLREYSKPDPLWKEYALKLGKAMENFPFEDDLSRFTFFGWLGTVMISGALPWRLNPWIVAKSNSGKTWLYERIISRIYSDGDIVSVGDLTKAYLARTTGLDSLPIYFEDMDADKIGSTALELIRMTASGSMSRGTADSSSSGGFSLVTMKPRASFYISSTQRPKLREEIANRIRLFYFKRKKIPVEEFGKIEGAVVETLTDQNALSIRNGLLLEGQEIQKEILAASKRCIGGHGLGNRHSFQAAAFHVGCNYFLGEDHDRLDIIYNDIKETIQEDDPKVLLRRIFSLSHQGYSLNYEASFEKNTFIKQPVLAWLSSNAENDRRHAQEYGFKYFLCQKSMVREPDQYELHFANTTEMSSLAKRLDMPNVDLSEILRQLDGVVPSGRRVRILGSQYRTFIIPNETLIDMGYAIKSNGIIDYFAKDD